MIFVADLATREKWRSTELKWRRLCLWRRTHRYITWVDIGHFIISSIFTSINFRNKYIFPQGSQHNISPTTSHFPVFLGWSVVIALLDQIWNKIIPWGFLYEQHDNVISTPRTRGSLSPPPPPAQWTAAPAQWRQVRRSIRLQSPLRLRTSPTHR